MTDCQATGVERLGGENASVRDLPPWSGHIEPAWNTNVVYHVYFFFKKSNGKKIQDRRAEKFIRPKTFYFKMCVKNTFNISDVQDHVQFQQQQQ